MAILRLVPLRDATSARQVSREMRDEVDETWRAWGIRAEQRHTVLLRRVTGPLEGAPYLVWACAGSHAHHLASIGEARLMLQVAAASQLNEAVWGYASNIAFLGKSLGDQVSRGCAQTPLMVAVRAQRPVGRGADGKVEWEYALGDEEVAWLVRAAVAGGMDLNTEIEESRSVLSYCAERGSLPAVKACLAAGAELETADWQEEEGEQWTPLMFAARGGHEEVLEALLEGGASVALSNGDYPPGVMAQVCEGRPTAAIVRRLAEAGATAKSLDVIGISALCHAASHGDLAVLQALVSLGADVKDPASALGTPLHTARSAEVVRWLVETQGANVNLLDDEGATPLRRARERGDATVIRALVALGARG